jgi:hypothetical protein
MKIFRLSIGRRFCVFEIKSNRETFLLQLDFLLKIEFENLNQAQSRSAAAFPSSIGQLKAFSSSKTSSPSPKVTQLKDDSAQFLPLLSLQHYPHILHPLIFTIMVNVQWLILGILA